MNDFPYFAEGYFALPSDDQLLAMNADEIFALAQQVINHNHAGWGEFRQTLGRLGIALPQAATGAALPAPVAEKLVDTHAATADSIATALQAGEWQQHVDEVSHLYPQPDQIIRAMGGNSHGIVRVVKQKLAALGVDVNALAAEIQAASSARFGECTLAEQLVIEANIADPTQPKSPETKAINWADQTYPGEGPDDPDVFYPRKNPKSVLEFAAPPLPNPKGIIKSGPPSTPPPVLPDDGDDGGGDSPIILAVAFGIDKTIIWKTTDGAARRLILALSDGAEWGEVYHDIIGDSYTATNSMDARAARQAQRMEMNADAWIELGNKESYQDALDNLE